MKQIIKSVDINPQDIDLINKYTRREMKPEERGGRGKWGDMRTLTDIVVDLLCIGYDYNMDNTTSDFLLLSFAFPFPNIL